VTILLSGGSSRETRDLDERRGAHEIPPPGNGIPFPSSSAAGAGPSRALRFDVFLDDREIGDHRFELRDVDGGVHVASTANFRVKAWILTAFRYEHESVERWQGGCLRLIESRTDSNGKRSTVSGSGEGEIFRVRSGDRDDTLEGCIRTFAYWT